MRERARSQPVFGEVHDNGFAQGFEALERRAAGLVLRGFFHRDQHRRAPAAAAQDIRIDLDHKKREASGSRGEAVGGIGSVAEGDAVWGSRFPGDLSPV